MKTTVIITECFHPKGKYWTFCMKDENSTKLAEVDRKNNKYVIYYNDCGILDLVATRSSKDSAMAFAKRLICENRRGDEVEFKKSVVSIRYRYA